MAFSNTGISKIRDACGRPGDFMVAPKDTTNITGIKKAKMRTIFNSKPHFSGNSLSTKSRYRIMYCPRITWIAISHT